MKILLAPYSARLPDRRLNAKNFHRWAEVVAMLNIQGHEVIQIGRADEQRIEGVSQFIVGWPLSKLRDLVNDCDTWMAVDTWIGHFCATERLKPGVVVWSQSDDRIWGYPHNTNLVKDRMFFRQYQYAPWWDAVHNPDAFVAPGVVVEAVNERLRVKGA